MLFTDGTLPVCARLGQQHPRPIMSGFMDLPTVTAEARRRILKGVARSPAAPDRVLHRLMRKPWAATEIAGRRQQMTEQLATALLETGNNQVAAALGRNRDLPTPVRWRLAAHADAKVRSTAVRRFAWPPAKPGCEISVALLTHLAADVDPEVRSEVAGHNNTPDDVRTRLASDPVVEVRVAVATWWKTPTADVRRALLSDPEPLVRKAACSPWHPVPPADLRPRLLAMAETRPLVAPHVSLTPALAAALARDPDEEVRAAVVGNPDLPQALRDELAAERNALVRYSLLVAPHTPAETRERLYEEVRAGADDDDEWFIVDGLLPAAWMSRDLNWLRKVSPDERLTLAGSPLAFLRCGVASWSDDLPEEAVKRLLNDPDPQVQKVAALCAASPSAEDLERIVWEHGDHRKVRPGILGRSDFPSQAYLRFATSERAQLRAAAATAALPADILEKLAADVEPRVRAAAAGNPSLPLRCLAPLLADEQRNVAEEAGASAHMPVEWMDALLAAEGME
ncbi:hypothetical protein [Yinghuangia seranimata]|uniref:hypothetical protein n=1 Tax=Yinghuangia seranimata TaxID=408067 RepID=UPI00248C805C|nr:hypothetical protein [Yinghuangia seranimata]MDI2129135.1 hypothetical protein [Yinghuangia seranimata]